MTVIWVPRQRWLPLDVYWINDHPAQLVQPDGDSPGFPETAEGACGEHDSEDGECADQIAARVDADQEPKIPRTWRKVPVAPFDGVSELIVTSIRSDPVVHSSNF